MGRQIVRVTDMTDAAFFLAKLSKKGLPNIRREAILAHQQLVDLAAGADVLILKCRDLAVLEVRKKITNQFFLQLGQDILAGVEEPADLPKPALQAAFLAGHGL